MMDNKPIQLMAVYTHGLGMVPLLRYWKINVIDSFITLSGRLISACCLLSQAIGLYLILGLHVECTP